MDLDQFRSAAIAPLLLVSDPVAALRWETFWLGGAGQQGVVVGTRPPARTVTAALDMLLDAEAESPDAGTILSAHQSATLWREIIANSPAGSRLISPLPAAAAAESAWRRLLEWNVPWQSLQPAGNDTDFSALLDWCRVYYGRLRAEGWLDGPSLIRVLAARTENLPRMDIASALSRGLSPRLYDVFQQRARSGDLEVIGTVAATSSSRLVLAQDSRTELQLIAEWIDRCRNAGMESLAVVVPDARERAAEIETVLGDASAGGWSSDSDATLPLWTSYGRSLASYGAPGAALNALELILGRGRFGQLSSFLRSPFFAAGEQESHAQRAAFEARFRTDLLVQWRFSDAFRHGGLHGRLRQALPESAARLQQAMRAVDARNKALAPTEWTDLWDELLRLLCWDPGARGTAAEVVAAWDHALRTFASSSAILGAIGASRALEEFRRIAVAARIRAPMTVSGVHVVESPEQVGPGYAGVWVSGFTDRRWPGSMRLNPLLPARLQRVHEMPSATPGLAHRDSRDTLERLLRNATDVIFSAPAQVDDVPMRPSRMLPLDVVHGQPESGRPAGYARARVGLRRCRSLEDPVPTATAAEVTGGTRLLELQASCPLRAFSEIRLAARPLERPWYGIPPRIRGIVLHRALELLFRPHAGAAAVEFGTLRGSIAAAVERAVGENIPWQHPPWDLHRRLEADRAARAIGALLERESRRGAVEIVAVEAQLVIAVGDCTLSGRIDRVDRLPDGSVVIYDYKTGQARPASAWYADRLLAPQMPAYAIGWPGAVGAFVIAAIGDDRVDYRGAGSLPSEHPAMPRPALAGDDWRARLDIWRRQIAGLLGEFIAGDVRIAVDRVDVAGDAFAPLSRIFALPDSLAAETGTDADD